MNTEIALKFVCFAQLPLCLIVFAAVLRSKLRRDFLPIALFLAVEALDIATSLTLLFYRRYTGLSLPTAYQLYFYSHWTYLVVEALLHIAIIFSVFSIAMRPLAGLHNMGKIIFRWIAAISFAMTMSLAIGAKFLSAGIASTVTFTGMCQPIQQGISVLLLCLMLFVCFATRPLGLTFRSRIFGVSVGLGVYAASQLIESAVVAVAQTHAMYSPVYLIGMIGACLAYCIWGVYFVLPEPKARMVLLPTTSPYFTWNRVSEVLGDDPGVVAIAGFTPDMLAPGELTVISAMSKTPNERRFAEPALQQPMIAA